MKRVRDKRETWGYKVHEPVAGNYYPVNSRIIMSESKDLKGKTVIVLNDRAQGGTSMNDGELEIMLHRRLLFDDAFGVGEALDEEQFGVGLVARGKHWVLICGGGEHINK
jgi:lysosomal alpha-mannosidase